MADPKVRVAIEVPVHVAEKLKRLAKGQQTTTTAVLIKLIGEEDDVTQRRAQATPVKVKA